MKRTYAWIAVLALATVLAGTGCRRVDLVESGYLKTDTRTVALEGATEAQIDLTMGAGDLSLKAGNSSTELLRGEFEYAKDSPPEFDYDVSGTRGILVVRQRGSSGWRMGTATNVWDLDIVRGVPVDLRVTLGAGRGNLDLRDVRVTGLDATMGAGETIVDLSGARTDSVSGRIEAGAGSIKVRVPSDVGVRITGHQDGVGDFTANGFKNDGRALVNDAWGETDVRIELQVIRGVGEIVLEIVD